MQNGNYILERIKNPLKLCYNGDIITCSLSYILYSVYAEHFFFLNGLYHIYLLLHFTKNLIVEFCKILYDYKLVYSVFESLIFILLNLF